MNPYLGAWMALRWVLNPWMLGAIAMATALNTSISPAWSQGATPQAEAGDGETAWAGGLGLGLLTKPEVAKQATAGLPPQRTLADGVDLAARPASLGTEAPAPADRPATSVREDPPTFPETALAPDSSLEAALHEGVNQAELADPAPSAIAQAETLEPENALAPLPGMAPAERSEVFVQAAYLQQGDELSARLRGGGIYVLSPSVLAGITADLSTGQAFSDSDQTGLSLSELYLTASPANLPELRFTVGLMDLTSYFDRNSFAKDSLTHFFNPVFQTNPALATANVASRPGALVSWMPIDAVSLTATAFSANRSLGSFALDSFAGEVGVRLGNAIVRGTYVSSVDAGRQDGFAELGAVDRGNGQFGALPGDRETGFGLNAEAFIPELRLGFFGRYGWYTNQTLGASGQTYSLGANGLDVFLPGDRLGLGYGRQLSNSDLRSGGVPDVWELFYDAQIINNLRAGVSVQQRNGFSETYLGLRVRYDLRWQPLRRTAE
jgi:hypothetical protein